ncbi:MAG: transcriptional repressor [Betaproteobacteria bacterium]|jgi:Fe2+/Zn2+ uptake regulation proteins|nr:transcriptional repressor [Betaproteobacteria bacterium]
MSHIIHETDFSCASERSRLVERLKSHHIIPTHQRLVIAQALFSRRQHVSADQLLSQVNLDHAEVSKATIYNTLNLFEEKGLVRRIVVDPERIFYDTHLESHPHLFNVELGELTDIEAPDLRIEGLPPLPPDLYQEGLDIVIRVRSRPPTSLC